MLGTSPKAEGAAVSKFLGEIYLLVEGETDNKPINKYRKFGWR
jgi:hypothetical protein